MIGLDTKVLAHDFVAEECAGALAERQRLGARALIESGQPLFPPKAVVLELAWVLRGDDGLAVEQGVLGLTSGLDFADAMHASCRSCESVASFDDRAFARGVLRLNLSPRIFASHS